MKLYKEPTIMVIASIMAVFAIGGAMIIDTGSQNATVDTKVPLPLQVGSHKNPSVSSSTTTTSDINTGTQASSASSIIPGLSSSKSTSSSSSSSSSSSNALTNPLGGK